jgi:hypothetical protein
MIPLPFTLPWRTLAIAGALAAISGAAHWAQARHAKALRGDLAAAQQALVQSREALRACEAARQAEAEAGVVDYQAALRRCDRSSAYQSGLRAGRASCETPADLPDDSCVFGLRDEQAALFGHSDTVPAEPASASEP